MLLCSFQLEKISQFLMKADTRADCQDSWMIQILESVIPLALDGLTFYHTVIRLM